MTVTPQPWASVIWAAITFVLCVVNYRLGRRDQSHSNPGYRRPPVVHTSNTEYVYMVPKEFANGLVDTEDSANWVAVKTITYSS